MKNIHTLPTDKPSRLFIDENILILDNEYLPNIPSDGQNQDIYITNDEEIKKGDWVLFMFDEVTEIVKVTTIINNAFETKQGFGYGLEYCKKIILTTDQDLIADGIQAIPLEEVPTKLDSVLAKITHQNDLGLSQWYEVVYYANGKWCSYSGSKTFKGGERVIEWKYCKELI